jgi:hypothetical protein
MALGQSPMMDACSAVDHHLHANPQLLISAHSHLSLDAVTISLERKNFEIVKLRMLLLSAPWATRNFASSVRSK